MNRCSLANKTLRLLAAQVNLNGTFHHACSFKNTNLPFIFVLQVERGSSGTLFTIVTGDEKHSLTVNDADKTKHLMLAEFIESIATGRMDTAEPATQRVRAESVDRGQLLDTNQQEQLHQLVRQGGSLKLDIGLDEVASLAVHRTQSRKGITAILVAGDSCPRTQCFTAYGDDQYSFNRLLQSLDHLAASAVPTALAA
ncbi:hypothetical protein SAMN04490203_2975 [Pseudomonas taetrolens]|uniref:Uncharacterized protein n=1 Tax=Pseudomonas taetrolens TaxID=47884 RepID=A0A0J6JHT8_PSETA|nr:hypothetical protein [Pseudomonas taetrolens]KMM83302.1 hypothetical protein TU78_19140 [Pseudomonas taetrolens]SEC71892.1 hypothetical protein SAMN04490203_2975 [Pseudomonas taetrolens]VEH50229.1 Uncharacterised protein [Pseudomonas taetrolens]